MRLSFPSLPLLYLLQASDVLRHSAAQSVAYVRQVSNVGGSDQTITDIQDAGDGSGRLFIVTQDGRIRTVRFPGGTVDDTATDTATLSSTPFVDISSRVRFSGERGLLGLAFHPQYASNGYFFLNYSDSSSSDTKIARCRASPPSANVATCNSNDILKTIDQTYTNHNGGQIQFGPDGYLYIGMGDGGSGNDPQGDAQSVSNCDGGTGAGGGKNCYLGKMLRVDVDNFSASTWSIPSDNPCKVDSACFGTDGSIPEEVWSVGLRNPWRFSFDSQTGDMIIADVGQNAREWVHFQPANSSGGENYGWCGCEGTRNNFRSQCPGPSSGNCAATNGEYESPIIEYAQTSANGQCIIGGYVYRGQRYPDLQGQYFYADYSANNMWMAQSPSWTVVTNPDLPSRPTTFGEDQDGNIFVGTSSSDLYLIRSTATPAPSPSPTSGPTLAPTPAGDIPTFSPISVGVTCPPSYQRTRVLSSNPLVELDYSVVLEAAPHNGIFCARLRYDGLAWVAVGRSPSGMIGSEPVIYKPAEGTALKYDVGTRNQASIVPKARQTLLGSSFSQTATATTLEFVKLLKEPDDLEIVFGENNNFAFAVGSGNAFGIHSERGSFTLDLALTDAPTTSPSKAPTDAPTKNPTDAPSVSPTVVDPTKSPTGAPTPKPTTGAPSRSPSEAPTNEPTKEPTDAPSVSPTTGSPTPSPTEPPTTAPTKEPTDAPSTSPTTGSPTSSPTEPPTNAPTKEPTDAPSTSPTPNPTTPEPTPFTCKGASAGCLEDAECCSFDCDNSGKPSRRTYLCVGGGGGAPTTAPPTRQPSPFVCKALADDCLENSECCSSSCDNKGKASSRTYTCIGGKQGRQQFV